MRIEESLQQVLSVARDAEHSRRVSSTTGPSAASAAIQDRSPHDRNDRGGGTTDDGANKEDSGYPYVPIERTSNDWKFNPVNPVIYDGPQPDSLQLPPLDEIMPVVEHYFHAFNSVITIFDQATFMRMLHSWYSQRGSHDRATWAAIQIVMALGYRTPKLGTAETAQLQTQKANLCLKNAQSVVSELVTREEDLLGIQILLGIVILFQNSRDPKPASVIIGTAVRLAHRLQLHVNQSYQHLTVEEAEQRSRVLWITYSLDKVINSQNNPYAKLLLTLARTFASVPRLHLHCQTKTSTFLSLLWYPETDSASSGRRMAKSTSTITVSALTFPTFKARSTIGSSLIVL